MAMYNGRAEDQVIQVDLDTAESAIDSVETNVIQSNYDAIADPQLSDDGTKGWAVGSEWVNMVAGNVFKCVANDTGSADWKSIASTAVVTIEQRYFIVAHSTSTANLNQTSVTQIPIGVHDSADTGWALSGNTFTYTGSPRVVVIALNMGVAGSIGRGNLIVRARKNGSNMDGSAKTGYIRNAGGHNDSSYHMYIIDDNPGTNPSYDFTSQREAAAGTLSMNTGQNQFSLEAID